MNTRVRFVVSTAVLFVVAVTTAGEQLTHDAATGLALVGANYQQAPPSEAAATAWSDAWEFAQAHPDDFGFPWADPRTGVLWLSAATPRGATLAAAWFPRAGPALEVPRRIRNVRFSVARLSEIQNGSIGRDSGLPERDAVIWMNAPDFEHNCIVLTLDHLSAPLLRALADRYAPEAVLIPL